MKQIKIYIDGQYSYKFKLSTWQYYLSYKTAVIKRVGSKTGDGSQMKSNLQALYDALQDVKEPCIITVMSKFDLHFDKARFALEKRLVNAILLTIIRAGHIVEYKVDKEFNQVAIWEQLYGTPINGKITVKNERKEIETAKPDIVAKKSLNDVFKIEGSSNENNYISLYDDDDLYSDRWVPGSGGY